MTRLLRTPLLLYASFIGEIATASEKDQQTAVENEVMEFRRSRRRWLRVAGLTLIACVLGLYAWGMLVGYQQRLVTAAEHAAVGACVVEEREVGGHDGEAVAGARPQDAPREGAERGERGRRHVLECTGQGVAL